MRAATRKRRAVAGVALLGLAFAGCGNSAGSAAPPELVVEVAGCAAVRAEPRCEVVGGRKLRLWIKSARDATVAIALDGRPVSSAGEKIDGGVLVSVEATTTSRMISVTATRAGATASRRVPLSPHEASPALDEAESLRRQGKLDEARSKLEALLVGARPTVSARALGKLARIARAGGDTERAVDLFRQAILASRGEGLVSDELLDRFALAYTLLYGGRRFADARAVLAELGPLEAAYSEGRAMAPYYRGLIEYEMGDLRAALRSFDASERAALRLGLADHRLDVLQPKANVLALLGRHGEAAALLEQAYVELPTAAGACRRAHLANDIGWLALRAEVAGDLAKRALAISRLEEALQLHREGCPEPADLCNVLTNLALAEVVRDAPDRARARLDEARRALPRPDARIEVWWILIEGRVALRSGKPEAALRAYDQLTDLARGALLAEARFEAELGRAQALDALGQADRAGAAYAAAEDLLDDAALLVPLGEGKDTFLGDRERGVRLRVEHLLRRAHAARDHERALPFLKEAVGAVRRSRARVLASLRWRDRVGALNGPERARWEETLARYRGARAELDAKAAGDWSLSQDQLAAAIAARRAEHAKLQATLDEVLASLGGGAHPKVGADLPAPREGELLLVYHPIADGWAGFAVTSRDVVDRSLGAIDANAPRERLAEQLLAPFREALGAARRVRFAAHGQLDRVDLHALPWNGRPLIAHAPVVYGLDLARADSAPRGGSRHATLIVDPTGDLPAARAEARAAAAVLEARGWLVSRLEGQGATHAAVRAALEDPGTRLFHYAGHGVFEGRDGWDSGLALAAGGRLTVGDVLALPRVPEIVVLSGCDTARTAETSHAEGLGLAQAFALVGAETALAATRRVEDRLAQRLVGGLYGSADGATLDPAAWLRDAQLAAARADAASDWASFRVLAP